MTERTRIQPILAVGTAESEAVETRVAEVFKRLGNRTRVRILLVLWLAERSPGDRSGGAPGVPFSELRKLVGVDDSGQFNYHLGELVGYFVEETQGGYRLTAAGRSIGRLIETSDDFDDGDDAGDDATDDGIGEDCIGDDATDDAGDDATDDAGGPTVVVPDHSV